MHKLTLLLLVLVTSAATTEPMDDNAPGLIGVEATDTTVQARRGDVLVVRSFTGRIDIRAGDTDQVRVVPSRSDREAIGVTREENRIVLGDRDRLGRTLERRVEVVVPAWLDVDVRGARVSVTLSGLRSDVSVQTGEGDIEVEDMEGDLSVTTVMGRVEVTDVRGRIHVRSVDESVRLTRVAGSVEVGSTDGNLILDSVDASDVDAQTVQGDVDFTGSVRPGASVRLVTHDGDVTAAIPRETDVDVFVSTFDGSFSADFPVRLERFRGGRETGFTLGGGGARLHLQAFDGEIRLRYLTR